MAERAHRKVKKKKKETGDFSLIPFPQPWEAADECVSQYLWARTLNQHLAHVEDGAKGLDVVSLPQSDGLGEDLQLQLLALPHFLALGLVRVSGWVGGGGEEKSRSKTSNHHLILSEDTWGEKLPGELTERLLKEAMHLWMSGRSGWLSCIQTKRGLWHEWHQRGATELVWIPTSMCLSSSLSKVGYLSSLMKGLLRPVVSVRIPGLPAPLASMNSPSTSLQDQTTKNNKQCLISSF